MRYAVIIEQGPADYGAYVPDLPGCVAVGETLEEATRLIREAIPLHIEAMRAHGETVPPPTSQVDSVEVEVQGSPSGRDGITSRKEEG